MKLITKKNHNKKVCAVLTLSMLAVAPLLNPVSAQPAPPTANSTQSITVRGAVVSNEKGSDFTLRGDNKRTYRVISRNAVAGLSKGDQVEVRGWIRNNMLIADSVRILQNLNGQGQKININGTVLTPFNNGSFQVRGSNKRTYTVVSRSAPPRLTRNDSVRIKGNLNPDGRTIIADSIGITRNNANWSSRGNLNFNGTVTRVASRHRFDVLGDNQRAYSINSVGIVPRTLSVGDRVRVVGQDIGRNIVRATQVTLISDINKPVVKPKPLAGTPVNFPGRVESLLSYKNGVASLRVRGDNGVLYTVHHRTTVRFAVGDRVRVVGRAVNNIVNATTVTR
jgi:cytochrome c-type biogenesis protein CcmE